MHLVKGMASYNLQQLMAFTQAQKQPESAKTAKQ